MALQRRGEDHVLNVEHGSSHARSFRKPHLAECVRGVFVHFVLTTLLLLRQRSSFALNVGVARPVVDGRRRRAPVDVGGHGDVVLGTGAGLVGQATATVMEKKID